MQQCTGIQEIRSSGKEVDLFYDMRTKLMQFHFYFRSSTLVCQPPDFRLDDVVTTDTWLPSYNMCELKDCADPMCNKSRYFTEWNANLIKNKQKRQQSGKICRVTSC